MKKILFVAILLLSVLVCIISPVSAGVLNDYEAANAAFQGQHYDEAIRLFTKEIESGELSQKDLSGAYCRRGSAWAQKTDWDKAIDDNTKAIEINPKDALAYYLRGLAWSVKGDYDKAIADFTKVIKLDPRDIDAYYNRGYVWEKKGDYDKAIADYTKVIKLDPEYIYAYYDLAWLMATCPDDRCRDGKRAVEIAEKAVGLENTVSSLHTLAAAYAEAGRFQDAITTQERAITKLKQEGRVKDLPYYEKCLSSYKAGKPWREK